jgi:hypothetical protein
MSLGLAAVCIMGLGLAAPAMGHNFVASRLTKPLSEAEPGKTKGTSIEGEISGERPVKLKLGAFEIFCAAKTYANTVAEGAISWTTSQTLSTEAKFTKCLTRVKFGEKFVGGLKTKFNYEEGKSQPIKLVYHVNGFAEFGTGETFSEVEVGSGDASFTIAGKICKVNWPRQTVPAKAEKKPEEEYSSAVYSNTTVKLEKESKAFPTAEQKRLVISNLFKGMIWNYEEGQCLGEGGFEEGAEREEGKNGFLEGDFEIQMAQGNLGFE